MFHCEIECQISIISRIAEVIHDKRYPGNVVHEILPLFKQQIFQIVSGYKDCNDSDDLHSDSYMKISCEKFPFSGTSLENHSTMPGTGNVLSPIELYHFAGEFIDAFIYSYAAPTDGILIDIDDTENPVHGFQQLVLFKAYYDNFCHMPVHAYEELAAN